MMQYLPSLIVALLPLAVQAENIVLSNDDGWAEINVRTFFNSLTEAGNEVVLSAPAENKSGTSSLDAPPSTVDGNGCQFNSCPPNSPPTGSDRSDPRLNYVNSFPVTAMKYGVQTLSPRFFGGPPGIVVSGPNVGSNIGIAVPFSGTVGAASAAADQLNIPGVAFSGASGDPTPYTSSPPDYALIYADLAVNLTTTLINSGVPYLPDNTWLNVNFPEAGGNSGCDSAVDFSFVLSRIFPAVPLVTRRDVVTCGNQGRLPTEREVTGTDGCFASVSVGRANDKLDAGAAEQGVVAQKLASILSCLP